MPVLFLIIAIGLTSSLEILGPEQLLNSIDSSTIPSTIFSVHLGRQSRIADVEGNLTTYKFKDLCDLDSDDAPWFRGKIALWYESQGCNPPDLVRSLENFGAIGVIFVYSSDFAEPGLAHNFRFPATNPQPSIPVVSITESDLSPDLLDSFGDVKVRLAAGKNKFENLHDSLWFNLVFRVLLALLNLVAVLLSSATIIFYFIKPPSCPTPRPLPISHAQAVMTWLKALTPRRDARSTPRRTGIELPQEPSDNRLRAVSSPGSSVTRSRVGTTTSTIHPSLTEPPRDDFTPNDLSETPQNEESGAASSFRSRVASEGVDESEQESGSNSESEEGSEDNDNDNDNNNTESRQMSVGTLNLGSICSTSAPKLGGIALNLTKVHGLTTEQTPRGAAPIDYSLEARQMFSSIKSAQNSPLQDEVTSEAPNTTTQEINAPKERPVAEIAPTPETAEVLDQDDEEMELKRISIVVTRVNTREDPPQIAEVPPRPPLLTSTHSLLNSTAADPEPIPLPVSAPNPIMPLPVGVTTRGVEPPVSLNMPRQVAVFGLVVQCISACVRGVWLAIDPPLASQGTLSLRTACYLLLSNSAFVLGAVPSLLVTHWFCVAGAGLGSKPVGLSALRQPVPRVFWWIVAITLLFIAVPLFAGLGVNCGWEGGRSVADLVLAVHVLAVTPMVVVGALSAARLSEFADVYSRPVTKWVALAGLAQGLSVGAMVVFGLFEYTADSVALGFLLLLVADSAGGVARARALSLSLQCTSTCAFNRIAA